MIINELILYVYYSCDTVIGATLEYVNLVFVLYVMYVR